MHLSWHHVDGEGFEHPKPLCMTFRKIKNPFLIAYWDADIRAPGARIDVSVDTPPRDERRHSERKELLDSSRSFLRDGCYRAYLAKRMVMRRGNGNNQMEKEPKKTLNRDGFAKEMQEVWRSRFGFDDVGCTLVSSSGSWP